MKIKLFIISLLSLIGASATAKADSYFPYPIMPDSVQFQDRCNYLAEHFWDFCDMTKAFSAKHRMAEELKVYLSVIEKADAPIAIKGVEALMKKLEKQPADQVFMATVAESLLHGDTAQVYIDELYLPFAEAVTANKKVSKAEKARFAQDAEILRNSLIGSPVPSLPYITREGEEGNIQNDSAQVVIVFFNDPDCNDCNMARLKLDVDISTNELIKEGVVKVVAISLCEPDNEWKEAVSRYPQSWRVAAAPDVDLIFDLRDGPPYFYILGRNGIIRYKHLNINQVLDISRQLRTIKSQKQ